MKNIVAVLYVILLISVYTDTTKGIIPNRLILPGCVIGLLISVHRPERILTAVVAGLIFYLFYLTGVIGAGDVKCLFMIGLYLEQDPYMMSILYGFSVAALSSFCILLKDFIFNKSKALEHKHTIHLAGPIFLGVIISTGGAHL